MAHLISPLLPSANAFNNCLYYFHFLSSQPTPTQDLQASHTQLPLWQLKNVHIAQSKFHLASQQQHALPVTPFLPSMMSHFRFSSYLSGYLSHTGSSSLNWPLLVSLKAKSQFSAHPCSTPVGLNLGYT